MYPGHQLRALHLPFRDGADACVHRDVMGLHATRCRNAELSSNREDLGRRGIDGVLAAVEDGVTEHEHAIASQHDGGCVASTTEWRWTISERARGGVVQL